MLNFTRIKVKNWKNFGNVDISIGDRLFVVGANASGKSNFLDIFRFLKDLANNGLQKAVKARGGIKKIRNLNARKPSYIEIDVYMSDPESKDMWEYLLQFNSKGGTSDNPIVYVYFECVKKNQEIVSSDRMKTSTDGISNQYTKLEQPASNLGFRDVFESFMNISYVNIIPQLIRESESFIPSNSMEDYYGRNLLAHIAETNKKTRTARLRKISNVLQMTVPQFSDLAFQTDDKGKPHLQVKYEHFRPAGAYQNEDQFSDGTLRLLGIIWAILDGDGVLLLEEPELYLHSEIVQQLPVFISNAQKKKKGKKRQVIISSHSFDLLNTDTIAADELAVLSQGKEDTIVEIGENVESIRNKIDMGFTPAAIVIPYVAPKGIIDGQLTLFDI